MGAPPPEASDAAPRPGGRERILTAALDILEREGEAAVKFADVAEQADVTPSVITHHFGTREGLLSAVHAERFAGLTAPDVGAVKELARAAADRADIERGMAALTDAVVSAERAAVRLGRVMAVGATHGRPELEAEVRRTATDVLDGLEHGIVIAQAKGLIDRSVDARVFATLVQAYALGMVITDLDETPVPRESLARLIDRLNFALLTDPDA